MSAKQNFIAKLESLGLQIESVEEAVLVLEQHTSFLVVIATSSGTHWVEVFEKSEDHSVTVFEGTLLECLDWISCNC